MAQNRFEAAFDRRRTAAQRAFGVEIYLQRGDVQTGLITARRPPNDYSVIGQEIGLAQDVVDREWIIAVADYAFGGTAKKPLRGDRIVEGEEVFEIMPDDIGPAAELMSGGVEWKVRTKQVR